MSTNINIGWASSDVVHSKWIRKNSLPSSHTKTSIPVSPIKSGSPQVVKNKNSNSLPEIKCSGGVYLQCSFATPAKIRAGLLRLLH